MFERVEPPEFVRAEYDGDEHRVAPGGTAIAASKRTGSPTEALAMLAPFTVSATVG